MSRSSLPLTHRENATRKIVTPHSALSIAVGSCAPRSCKAAAIAVVSPESLSSSRSRRLELASMIV